MFLHSLRKLRFLVCDQSRSAREREKPAQVKRDFPDGRGEGAGRHPRASEPGAARAPRVGLAVAALCRAFQPPEDNRTMTLPEQLITDIKDAATLASITADPGRMAAAAAWLEVIASEIRYQISAQAPIPS